ncbi:HD domain-containing protein [Nibribacter koreensis]|uniref:ATP-binding protein n=1 Tax=Nibribacter koreensis TaxID=1084519 RepID=A0ABP8F4Z9_9BACT
MKTDNKVAHPFSGLKFWEYFLDISKGHEEVVVLVNKHIDITLPLLDNYIKAFPKYTLHNSRHQKNIIRIYGELLNDDITKVSLLESVILILSAVYHDVGMVFSEDEIKKVVEDERFVAFLDDNIKAKLIFEVNNKQATSELVEWFCRWSHANRVWDFLHLNDVDYPLFFEGIPFKNELGAVCESHNFSVDFIKNSLELNENFHGNCDLKFCSIILRLADILDFDNTRSPQSVFDYLELNNPKNSAEKVSSEEWGKHLQSRGFDFKTDKDVKYLYYKAAPTHPKIEVGIRNFLKLIYQELQSCSDLLRFCSPKWQDFKLPLEIDETGIRSVNYKSGNYHFSLSEDKILNLLTGEGLYDDEFVFIRELLQNAIDASRYRLYLERIKNTEFVVEPIEVSFFSDIEGYNWVRIDDFGCGMDEKIILNHLLKKGDSYYNSDRFKLERILLQNKTGEEFVPISRFGIGLLSCFIVGDKIELNTRFHGEDGKPMPQSFRVSVENQNGIFVLQSNRERHVANAMPSSGGPEFGYRRRPGTSIAVRLMTRREYFGFNFKAKLEDFVLCSPVPILYNGEVIGGDFNDILLKPWAEESSLPVTSEVIEDIQSLFDLQIPSGISLDIIPIDITNESLESNLKGQVVFFGINSPELSQNSFDWSNKSVSIRVDNKDVIAEFVKKIKIENTNKEEKVIYKFENALSSITIPNISVCATEAFKHYNSLLLSHNGVVMRDSSNKFLFNKNLLGFNGRSNDFSSSGYGFLGVLYFEDDFLPQLSVARNEIKELSFKIVANSIFSLRKLNRLARYSNNEFNFFDRIENTNYFSIKEINSSKFYEKNKAFWDNQRVFVNASNNEELSIVELVSQEAGKVELLPLTYSNSYSYRTFFNSIFSYALLINFNISLRLRSPSEYDQFNTLLINGVKTSFNVNLDEIDPLRIIPFENESVVVAETFINESHRLVQWYIKSFPVLFDNFNHYCFQLLNLLLRRYYFPLHDRIDGVNQVLSRLRTLLPAEHKPDISLNLSKDDFLKTEGIS